MDKNVTIIQIAKECGVSIATVSRVINGTVPVSEETRRRVQAVIDKYHFSPNAMARGLINRRSMTLGVMLPDITNPYFALIFREIEREAHAAGYAVFLCNTMYSSRVQDTPEEEYFQMLHDKQVDGLIVVGGQLDLTTPSQSYCDALRHTAAAVPTVVIGPPLAGVEAVFLTPDTGAGIAAAVRHLAAQGHRHIAFLGGEPGVTITCDRLDAYRAALAAAELPCTEYQLVLTDYYLSDGFAAANKLMSRGTTCTALLAINDSVALGVLRALADWGKTVPQDFALVSCDQFPGAEYHIPRLTAIDHHSELLAHSAVQQLLAAMQGAPKPEIRMPDAELIIRESSLCKL